ncbi:FapA family protein [bacterium]|nr:FapA family protein [bacterium]
MEDKSRLDALEEMGKKLHLMEENIHKDEMSVLESIEEQLRYLESSLEKISSEHDHSLDGKIKLEFADEKTEAYITITAPKIGGKKVNFDDVMELLLQEKIKDIDEEVIIKVLKAHTFDKRFLIAKGIPSKYTGRDACFAYQCLTEDVAISEEVLPGQLIFYKTLPTYGEGGISVTGEKIPPCPGKDIKVIPGNKVVISENKTRGYALERGHVFWEGDIVSVEKIKEVKGDVDSILGNINFKGRVHIYGSVSDGITIKTTGDLIVDGKVEEANLEADGNIKIGQSMVGGGTSKTIKAKGNIIADSLEKVILMAGKNLIINKNIVNSDITASKVIVVESGSFLRGGKVVAQEIDVPNIGLESKEKKGKIETILNIQNKVSVREKIYPSVKLSLGNINYPLSEEKERVTMVIQEGKVEIIDYEQIPPLEEPIQFEEPKEIVSTLTPFVILETTSLLEAKEEAAEFLGLERNKLEIQEISKTLNEEGETTYKLRIFSKDATPPYPWEEEIEVEPVDGRFRIIPASEGLYLTVYPPEGKGKRTAEEEVLKEIEEKEYDEVNLQLVKETVNRAKGASVIIGPKQHNEMDGSVNVNVTEDFSKAAITFIPPKKGGNPVEFKDVIKALKKKGVVELINEKLIKDTIRENKFDTPSLMVAEQILAQAGPNAEIEILIKTDTSKIVLAEDDRGRVDFRERSNITNVTKGQILAIKRPLENPGTAGKKINGEIIPPPPPLEMNLSLGKNTEISEDGLKLHSIIDGQAIYINEKINVEPVFEVKGDVNMVTGNIDFLGTVVVNGNILDGFKVKAEGDIQVKEVVEGAILFAGANINIGGGVLGKNKATLFAEGDIVAKYAESAHLVAKGNIKISEFVLHSFLEAGKIITVTEGKRGSIMGGKIRATECVNAREIGSPMSTKTIIEVGVKPQVREQLINIEKLSQEDNKKFERIRLDIITLKNWQKENGNLSPEKEQLLTKLIKLQNLLIMKLRSYSERKELLEAQIARADKGNINIIGTVYPGTTMIIRGAAKEVKEVSKAATFFFENNEVHTKAYQGS